MNDIGLPSNMSRSDAYVQGIADGEEAILRKLRESRPTVDELNTEVKRAIEFVNHGMGMTLPTDPITINSLRASLHSGDYRMVKRDDS